MKRGFSKTIGIIGGAGPMASAFLYSSILRVCQTVYNANDYSDFPEIVLISHPFTRGNKEAIQRDLAACLSRLTSAGAHYICIASHSFHGLLPKDPLPQGFINLVDEGLAEAARLGLTRALILGAPLTISMKLYERSKIQCVYPREEDQQMVNEIIREIAGGRVEGDQSKRLMNVIAKTAKTTPFDGVIVACTELPLALAKTPIAQKLPIIDTMQVLSLRLVSLARAT